VKKYGLFLLILLLCIFVVSSIVSAQEDKIILRLAHPHAPSLDSDIHVAALVFAEYVNRFSDGRIEVKIYHSAQLGSERDYLEALQLGAGVDCCMDGTAIMANFTERIGVLDLPFLWKNYEQVHQILDGQVGKELATDLEKVGIKVLAWFDSWGFRNLLTKKEIKNVDDLKGLKIRCIATPTNIAAIDLMGANPSPTAYGEVYTALQTGVLDGMEHSLATILGDKFYEIAKHITFTEHLFGPLLLNFSMGIWDTLNDQDKQLIQTAANVASYYQRSLAEIQDQKAYEKLKTLGVHFNDIDTSQFREEAKSFNVEYAEKIGVSDMLEIINSIE